MSLPLELEITYLGHRYDESIIYFKFDLLLNVSFSKFKVELAAIASLQQTRISPFPVLLSHFTVTYTSCPLDGRTPTKQAFPVHCPIGF